MFHRKLIEINVSASFTSIGYLEVNGKMDTK